MPTSPLQGSLLQVAVAEALLPPNGPSSPSNATSTIPLSTLKETMTAAAAFPGSTLTANSGLGGNKPAANSALSMGLLAMSVTSGVVVAMTAALLL
ncbi:hypothetical protein BASA83_005645 [Batrachochytrium salamandrivorans]|nr:hypothetical protein BASA83_005645 [Batrachochytrium salamandrivorans]